MFDRGSGKHATPDYSRRRLVTRALKERSSRFYSISPDHRGITCHVCGRTSTHPHDVEKKFCPYCFAFHEDRVLMVRLDEGYRTEYDPLAQDWHRFKSAA